MKKLYSLIPLCLLFLVASCAFEKPLEPEDLVNELQKSDRLYVTEYVVHKLVTASDAKKIDVKAMGSKFSIPTAIGDRKIAIPMTAVLKAYVDFETLTPDDIIIMEEPRSLTLLLNAPKVEMTSSKIDHDQIKEFTSFFRASFTDAEMSNYEKLGRQSILASIPNMGIVATAKQNARDVLVPILMQSGFDADQIKINFKN